MQSDRLIHEMNETRWKMFGTGAIPEFAFAIYDAYWKWNWISLTLTLMPYHSNKIESKNSWIVIEVLCTFLFRFCLQVTWLKENTGKFFQFIKNRNPPYRNFSIPGAEIDVGDIKSILERFFLQQLNGKQKTENKTPHVCIGRKQFNL